MMKGVRYGTNETGEKRLLVGSQLQQIARKCCSHSFYVNVLWGHAVTPKSLRLHPSVATEDTGPCQWTLVKEEV